MVIILKRCMSVCRIIAKQKIITLGDEGITFNDVPFIEVSCAIIEENGKVLAAQRSNRMRMPLKWEFPGGKIDPGETADTCIIREIKEELGINIHIKAALPPVRHSYPDFRIRLHPFVCELKQGRIELKDHRAARWLDRAELLDLDWADADVAIVKSYLKRLEKGTG